MTKKLLFAFAFAFSLSLSMLATRAQATTSLWVRITSVAAFTDGASQVFVSADLPTGCSDKRSFRVVNEAMVREVIAAMLAKREVRVNTAVPSGGSTASCSGSLDNVTWVQTR